MPADPFVALAVHHKTTGQLIERIRASAADLRANAAQSKILLAESRRTLEAAYFEKPFSFGVLDPKRPSRP